jgi:hypothetical protein
MLKAFAAANYAYVHNITRPTTPNLFVRYVDTTPSQSSYTVRANQYKYTFVITVAGTVCNLYCGPRAFLIIDSKGNFVCWRDQDPNFWGSQPAYGKICIPDVEKTPACNVAVPTLFSVGYCDMVAYILISGYSNYECCYDDHNSGSAKRTELTKRDATTTYFSLRNA